MKSSLLREGNRRDDCSFSIFMSFRDHCFLIGKRFAGVSARYLKKKTVMFCVFYFLLIEMIETLYYIF